MWNFKAYNDFTSKSLHTSQAAFQGCGYASINANPERGGGGPRAYVGHLTSIAFSTLGNLTKNLGPRVGTFAFMRGGIGPSHIILFARLCTARL